MTTFTGASFLGSSLKNGNRNKLHEDDRAAHDWYRFVLSYPPQLVREYLERFSIGAGQVVLDPFCGTGTTLVECKKQGIEARGLERHPMAHFAASTKTDWSPSPSSIRSAAGSIAAKVRRKLKEDGIDDEIFHPKLKNGKSLSEERLKLLLTGSICPAPLHKVLTLLEAIERAKSGFYSAYLKLALAKAVVTKIGNLHFGPEVGVGKPKLDTPVIAPWLEEVERIARDLQILNSFDATSTKVYRLDARDAEGISRTMLARCVSAVITSPPYPNEKDYTRTTRLESVLLGFIANREELRVLKKGLVRSNTRGVYWDDTDHLLVEDIPEISDVAEEIERRRLELGKTSGFERMYPRVTRLYFGGMMRHLEAIKSVLRPGAMLGYVVGDQASYLRVMIRTGQLIALIGERLGYEVVGIDLFRTRLATATREQLREEVVVLRWRGAV